MRIACALLGAVAIGAGGCSLVLDFSDPPPDATPPDALVPDAIGGCDVGEPNESRDVAYPLDPVTGQVAGICTEGDQDYYALTVADGQSLSFQIRFPQDGAAGDLDLYLLDSNGAIVARSLSADADEGIVCPGDAPACPQLAAGTYYALVFGYQNANINGYTIDYTLTGP